MMRRIIVVNLYRGKLTGERLWLPGDTYTVSEVDAQYLIDRGVARPAPDTTAISASAPVSAVAVAEPDPAAEPEVAPEAAPAPDDTGESDEGDSATDSDNAAPRRRRGRAAYRVESQD